MAYNIMLFLLVFLVYFSFGEDLADQCCYTYEEAPGNNSDYIVSEGIDITLHCTIRTPRPKNSTSLVQWYKKTNLVNQEVNFDSTEISTSSESGFNCTNGSAIYEDSHSIVIPNFTHADNGIYWCKIKSKFKDVCLSPSKYVNITVGIGTNQSVALYIPQHICAENNNLSSCNRVLLTTIPQQTRSSTLLSTNRNTISHITQAPSQLNLCKGDFNIQNLGFAACLGVTVPAAGLLLILVANIICCIGICLCWRKQKRKAVLNFTETESVAQTTTQHSTDGNQALVRKQKTHQYEDVENPQPKTNDNEESLVSEPTPASSQVTDAKITTTDQDISMGAVETADSQKNPTDIHTYETVTLMGQNKLTNSINQQKQSQTESINSRYEDVCENQVLKKTQCLSSQNESSSDNNQYSILNHGLSSTLSNPAKKVGEGDDNGASDDLYYSKPHTFSFTASSAHEKKVVANEYQNTGRSRHRTLSQKHQQNSIRSEPQTDDHEYHILEEIPTEDATDVSNSPMYDTPFDAGQKTDSVTKAASLGKEKAAEFQETGFGPIKEEVGQKGVFDDPQYSIGQEKVVVNEPEFPFDEFTAEVHEVWLNKQ